MLGSGLPGWRAGSVWRVLVPMLTTQFRHFYSRPSLWGEGAGWLDSPSPLPIYTAMSKFFLLIFSKLKFLEDQ